jgi:hypothetical protein
MATGLTAEQQKCTKRIRQIIDSAADMNATYNRTGKMLADFFAEGLDAHMTYASGEPIPEKKRQKYFATAFKCDQSHVSRLLEHGRQLRELMPMGIKQLPERATREFSKLEDREKLVDVVDIADGLAATEHETKGWRGKPRIKAKHVKQAVEEVQGKADAPKRAAKGERYKCPHCGGTGWLETKSG